MFKKFIIILVCFSLLFTTGCSPSKQIDKASLAETVTVDYKDGRTIYSFYLVDSEEDVNSVSVAAESLEQACYFAKQSYIPNLSLAKFEMLIVNKKIYSSVLKRDIDFISSEYYMSPLSYVTLCDDAAIKLFTKTKDAPKQVEEHILLLKNKDDRVKINSISIFNNLKSSKENEFYIPYISSEKELKSELFRIDPVKMRKNN